MLKKFIPFHPFQTTLNPGKKLSLWRNEYIPTHHVAELIPINKEYLLKMAHEWGVEIYTDPSASRSSTTRGYASYISIKDLPIIMKQEGWSKQFIEEGMRGLKEIQARPRNGYQVRRKGTTYKKKNKKDDDDDEDQVEDIDDDDDDFEVEVEVEEENKPKKTPTPPTSVVPRKRDRSESSNNEQASPPPPPPPPTSSSSVSVSEELKRMETLYEQTHALVQKQSKLLEQSMDMMGEQALLTYVKTDTWRDKKEKALKEAIAAELPSIRETVKDGLRTHYGPIIQAEVRKEHEDNLQNNNNAEAEVFRSVLSKQRNLVIVPSSPPHTQSSTSNTPHNNAVWLSAFLQEEKNNYTE